MNKDKIIYIRDTLQEKKQVSFRLYNALYKINLTKSYISIHQIGLDVSYQYDSLKNLLEDYVVYGQPLIELISDMKICK